MRRTILLLFALLLCLLAASCNYGSIYSGGTNVWDAGIRTGVQGHYYNYSGY